MQDIVMMVILALASSIGAGLAFGQPDVVFLAPIMVILMYGAMYLYEISKNLRLLISYVLTGQEGGPEINPLLAGTITRLRNILKELGGVDL